MKPSSFATCAVVVLALLVFLRPMTSRAAMGDLDTSFGPNDDGMVSTDFSDNDYGDCVVIDSEGRILVAGYANNGSDDDFALARYSSDGELDTSFGTDGRVFTDFDSNDDHGYSMAIDNEGRILVAGYADNGSDDDFALARYTSDGELDTSFGTDGKVTTDFGSDGNEGRSMVIDADGKILLAGQAWNGSDYDFALARYTSAGVLDSTFGGGDGLVTTDFGSTDRGYSMVIDSEGRILVAGCADNGSDYDFALARYTSAGVLDTDFGSGGKVTTNFGTDEDRSYSMVTDEDGKILLVGMATVTSNALALARYGSDGTLDTDFGSGGTVTTDFGFPYILGLDVAIQADGKIVVTGTASTGVVYNLVVARYDTSGTVDTTFGTDGLVLTDFDSGHAQGSSVVIQDEAKILVAGTTFNSAETNFDFALARYIGLDTPAVLTTAATDITASSASSGGDVTDNGGTSVTARGVCWNTSGSPALGTDSCTDDGSGAGAFSSSLTGLSAGNTYHVRAYATNSVGTVYGDEESFTTTTITPSLTTTSVSDITSNSASSGGNVTDDGGATVTARGVCWNTSGSPVLGTDTCSADGSGTGSFSSTLIALSASSTYYARAYAANASGTAYGDEESFTTSQDNGTSPGAPSVETGTPEPTSCTCATIPGNVTDEGGATVSQRGVCYTMVNDTATWCVSCSSSGGGSFSVELTELEPATQYTAFAYAVNSFGMGGGAVTTFTTPALHDHVLFFRNTNSGQTALMYFSGTTRQGYATSVQAGQVWQAKDVANFDQDNSPDTMWQNQESGQMVLVSMNNYLSGDIQGKGTYPEWSASVCGDFNGDGHKDAVWRDSESGQVVAQLFENLEPVKFQNTLELSNLNWLLSTAGDFNSDGTDDLVFRNLEKGGVGIVLLEDAVYASVAFLPDVEDQTFSVVAALDMNLDGSTDLVWHNADTGDLYVEYLSGVEHLRYGYLTHAPPEWIPFGGASYQ